MRVKVDEDLPRAAAIILREAGYEAIGVREQSMGGYADAALWRAVQAEGRFLVTADKGFADIRFYAPGTHAGVLLLRPEQDGIRPVIELLERVLANFALETLAEAVAVATPRGVRIRRER